MGRGCPRAAWEACAADIRKAATDHFNEVKAQLVTLDRTIADDEAAIHQLAQPEPHVFKLAPMAR